MRNSHFFSRREETFLTRVRKLPSSYHPSRGGAIPLILHSDGRILFGLGVDSTYNQLTDFSGGISYHRKEEDFIEGSLREFHEETLGIFGDISSEEIQDCLVLHNSSMMLILLPFEITMKKCNKAFAEAHANYPLYRRPPEISRIEWVDYHQLKLLSREEGSTLYKKLKDFLRLSPPFFELL